MKIPSTPASPTTPQTPTAAQRAAETTEQITTGIEEIVTLSQDGIEASRAITLYGKSLSALQAMGPANVALTVLQSSGHKNKATEAVSEAFPELSPAEITTFVQSAVRKTREEDWVTMEG